MRNPYPTAPSLFMILLCCMYIYRHILLVSALCLEDQRSLLLQLKNNLTFNNVRNSSKLDSWNQSIPCCQWSGVIFDEEGQVTGLDLSGEWLSCVLDNSSSLFSLHYLENLNLAYNDFNTPIPIGFQMLKNLTYLNLSLAGFVGQIPPEISQLTRLVTLDISSPSHLRGQELKLENPNLQKLVQNLTSIKQLHLDGVSITGQGQEWSKALLSLPDLQELSMSHCKLSGPLPSSFSRLENLSVIILDGNSFSSLVPATFANFKNLTTLSLVGCGLRGMFPQKIFLVKTLSFIDISDNIDLHGSLPDFQFNSSLKTLRVSITSFSGPLSNSISNLRQLSTLVLSQSQFDGTLPNSLSNLTQLVELDLFMNRFSGSVPSLATCKRLQRVVLCDNNFTGAIPSTHFEGLANLVVIDLYNNSFTGKIPSSISMLSSLQVVDLSSNEFYGQLNDLINASSRIQVLDLSGNHLEGPIPIFVFQLKELIHLVLSSNKFNGTIELNIFSKLGNLTTLDLSNNNLSIIDAEFLPPLFPTLQHVGLASCNVTTFPQFTKTNPDSYISTSQITILLALYLTGFGITILLVT